MDAWLAEAGAGGASMALIVAVLLGLRHATDPDHLAAVSTLVLGDEQDRAWAAGVLGLSWGMGHAATLVALGIPVVLFGHFLPETVGQAAEVLVGAIIIALAVRLLHRWRAGRFRTRPLTSANASRARHPLRPHVAPRDDSAVPPLASAGGGPGVVTGLHEPRDREVGRSPLSAFGIGTVHGVGGSAGAGILLVTAGGRVPEAALALVLFAAATAVSMALVSGAFGYALTRGPLARSLTRTVPVFGLITLLFGIWYALGALQVVPYGF